MSLPPVPPVPPVIDPARVAEVARRVDFRLRSRGLWPTVTVDGARVVVELPRPVNGVVVINGAAYSRSFFDILSEVDADYRADEFATWIVANETAASMLAWEASEKAKRAP